MGGHGSSTFSSGSVQPHVSTVHTSEDDVNHGSHKLPAELLKSSSASTLSSADVAVDISSSNSIYDLHNNRHRWLVLLQVAVAALLVPFTDTIYLPALPAVGEDLRASDSAVAATVSVFLFAIGIGNVFWGPFSDRFGRRVTYNICTVVYIGTTLGCAFSPNVDVLIAMRALQGFAQCSFLTTGQAVVADVFPPAFRGMALGIFMMSVLLGSVVAPMIGGALAASQGWRATLVFLAICGGAFGLVLLIFLPETHQHMVLSRLLAKDAPRVNAITESSKILATKPVFQPPWGVLKYLYHKDFAPYIFANGWGTACVFCVMTVWPLYASEPPYNLDQAMVGVTYVVSGAGAIIGSLLGGRVSDRGAVVFGQKPEGRVVFDLAFAAVSMPVGLLLFGWGIAFHYHLAVILVALFLVGFGTSSLQPGVYSYVSCVDQDKAGAASAAVNAAWCTIAAVVVLVNVPGIDSLGVGGYLTLVAGIHLLLVAIAGAFSIHRLR